MAWTIGRTFWSPLCLPDHNVTLENLVPVWISASPTTGCIYTRLLIQFSYNTLQDRIILKPHVSSWIRSCDSHLSSPCIWSSCECSLCKKIAFYLSSLSFIKPIRQAFTMCQVYLPWIMIRALFNGYNILQMLVKSKWMSNSYASIPQFAKAFIPIISSFTRALLDKTEVTVIFRGNRLRR